MNAKRPYSHARMIRFSFFSICMDSDTFSLELGEFLVFLYDETTHSSDLLVFYSWIGVMQQVLENLSSSFKLFGF